MRTSGILTAGLALLGAGLVAIPAAAQNAQTAPAPVPQAAPADPAAQIAALREEVISAQQEIVRLRGLVANQQDLEASLKAAREKNERLVAIANELIAAYEKRYQRGQFLPFDSGRRKFEEELQATGDRIYDNRWDAGPRRAPAPKAGQPAPTKKQRQNDQ